MSQDSKALRSAWFQVGDEVVMDRDPRKFIVHGFGLRYVGRGGMDQKRAGIYIDFNKVQIAYHQSGPVGLVDACKIWSENNTDFPRKHARSLNLDIKIGLLPETPFWVGDHVISPIGPSPIDFIKYDDPKGILYVVGGSCNKHCKAEDLVLVMRGNIWKLFHGELLNFADIEAEAQFYKSLGMSQKVKNSADGSDLWNANEAIDALIHRRGHQMKIKDPKSAKFVVIKYEYEEFGERMRVRTLKQFGFAYPPAIPA